MAGGRVSAVRGRKRGLQVTGHGSGVERLAEQIALHGVAAQRAQEIALFFEFDALGEAWDTSTERSALGGS